VQTNLRDAPDAAWWEKPRSRPLRRSDVVSDYVVCLRNNPKSRTKWGREVRVTTTWELAEKEARHLVGDMNAEFVGMF
jgi:hypothetical protein